MGNDKTLLTGALAVDVHPPAIAGINQRPRGRCRIFPSQRFTAKSLVVGFRSRGLDVHRALPRAGRHGKLRHPRAGAYDEKVTRPVNTDVARMDKAKLGCRHRDRRDNDRRKYQEARCTTDNLFSAVVNDLQIRSGTAKNKTPLLYSRQ